MKKAVILFLVVPFLFFAQTKRAITVEDLWSMKRIGTFDVSPDQKSIAFSFTFYSMEENKGNSDIYIINSDGTDLRPFKNSADNESEPKFSPDGGKLAFVRDSQIWTADLNGSGEEKITSISTGASGFEWSPNGKSILFISSVYPECKTDECNQEKDKALEESQVKAKLFKELMYRHWNTWRGDKRSHLFVMNLDDRKAVDLTRGSDADVPPFALGSSNDYSFSPAGDEVAFTTNTDDFISTSTNNDVFIVKLRDIKSGSIKPVKISQGEGNDNQPVYSPDGKYIAFTSMGRGGFEADKQEIILYDRKTGSLKNLTEKLDRSVGEFVWSDKSDAIYFVSANEIYNSLFKIDIASGEVSTLIKEAYISGLSFKGGKLYYQNQSSDMPTELFFSDVDGKATRQITHLNKDVLSNLEMNPVETFWSEGAEGAKVQSILIRPPFFDETKTYPMVFLIHGGPQGHWSDDFHYRWNMQMFAVPGYVVVAPNPRGSTGYGQKFTDEISGDWGGKPYIDLMNAYEYALENFSFIDDKNTFAAGASYGGYMINWIAGHTDRFNALVSHAGVFNLESMYGTTEELWFPEWEFKGTPWESREVYERWSPHRYIHNAKTPVLVSHGANDFRVSEEQGFQLFTSLQRLGVESQFLYFPDEYHFVTKPQNAKLWWNTIYNWFEKHLK
jgi:dipeptidyl aminopeptidase/acylaminoacyl peptidase